LIGEPAAVPLRRPSIVRDLGIVTRAGRSLSPASRAFLDCLVETIAR